MSTTIQRKMVMIKKTITPKREEYLRGIHRRLRKAAKTAFGSEHGRFDFYNYLELILKTYWIWRRKKRLKEYGRQFGALFGIPPRKGLLSLHYLIQTTSHGDGPLHSLAAKKIATRDSRWVQGLRYAAKYRSAIEKQGLEAFCKSNGGIAGCERKLASKSRGKNPKKRQTSSLKVTNFPDGTLVARIHQGRS